MAQQGPGGEGGAKLTTHVLDTARGRPAAGLKVSLFWTGGGMHRHLASATTNADGRLDGPLLEGAAFEPGQYELLFKAGAYLRAQGVALPETAFLDEIPIRFGMSELRHYHVPLLLSPYGYSTYRGS